MKPQLLIPNWPAPERVRAIATTRRGGISEGAYTSCNMALHVGDQPQHVLSNRAQVAKYAQLPSQPVWLKQVHGNRVVVIDDLKCSENIEADAAVSFVPGKVCVILTADCFPLLFCDQAARCVAAAHIGWRGLASGLIEKTVATINGDAGDLLVWIGAGISACHFQIGSSVRDLLLGRNSAFALAILPNNTGQWTADLPQMIAIQLRLCGVERIFGGHDCTYSDPKRFYSYRYHQTTGRMASMIWLV